MCGGSTSRQTIGCQADCSVSHLVLYDIDSIWHHISSVSHLYCANPLPSVSAFNKLAKMAIGDVTEEQKLPSHLVLSTKISWAEALGSKQQVFCLKSVIDEHASEGRMPHMTGVELVVASWLCSVIKPCCVCYASSCKCAVVLTAIMNRFLLSSSDCSCEEAAIYLVTHTVASTPVGITMATIAE